MGLLDNQTPQEYYNGNDFGNYQFVSLKDIIDQFMFVYVGEDKIISKVSRTDIAFHAQRALAELSFDTFKSHKAQEIIVPPTLQMALPQDYVNYTAISRIDDLGIKHRLYPTSKTSNATNQFQDEDGKFQITAVAVEEPGSSTLLLDAEGLTYKSYPLFTKNPPIDRVIIPGTKCFFLNDESTPYFVKTILHDETGAGSIHYAELVLEDANGVEYVGQTLDIMAGLASAPDHINRTIRFETDDGSLFKTYNDHYWNTGLSFTFNTSKTFMVLSNNPVTKYTALDNVRPGMKFYAHGQEGYGIVTDIRPETESDAIDIAAGNTWPTIYFDSYFPNPLPASKVTFVDEEAELSDTWSRYKSSTPSENSNYNYNDDTYWPYNGNRYGLDPQHAQANGSFYIDGSFGKIHFSSNISGKTVILDYISDGLGTEDEMKVPKLAEEAMYRSLLLAVASGRIQTQQLVPRLKKEKFAAVRTAKLRLSNIKLEELTQILRGKSKWIKH